MRATRQDHYLIARDTALRRLRSRMEPDRLNRLGARLDPDAHTITVRTLCWEVEVQCEPYAMRLLPDGEEPGIVWQILILNYLAAEKPVPSKGFVSFADFAEGRGYQRAFEARVNARLSHTVGAGRESFLQAADRLGGAVVEGDPLRCILRFFPLVEFQVVRSEADEDFPASCNVLFSDNMLDIFSLEDGIVAAERLVSALAGKTPAALAKVRKA